MMRVACVFFFFLLCPHILVEASNRQLKAQKRHFTTLGAVGGVSLLNPRGTSDEELYAYIGGWPKGGYNPNKIADNGYIYMQHLRKAGGTTLCAVIGANMPSNAMHDCFVYIDRGEERSWQRSLDVGWDFSRLETAMHSNNVTFVTSEDGVFPHWIDFHKPSRLPILKQWSFVTAVRFPLDRMLSLFTYQKRLMWGPQSNHRCGSTQAFMNDPTKAIKCLKEHEHVMYDPMAKVSGINYYTRVFSGKQSRPLGTPDLVQAIQTLNNFAVVLVTEWFQEDAVALKYMFGFDKVLAVPRNAQATNAQTTWSNPDPLKNRVTAVPKETKKRTKSHYSHHSHARDKFSAEDYEYLEQLHAYDLKLYKVVQEMSRRRNARWLHVDMFKK
jgi:hypothetical protein